jgi:VWFA-related protein
LPLSLAPAAPAQTNAPSDPTVIKGGSEEVLLDLIVRDKKGRTVRDLEPSEVEVSDNGQVQKIKSFRLVDGAEATANKSKTPLDPMRQVRLVTLVFQGLDDNGRRLSRQAALDLLKNELGPNVFYAVFSIDNQLNALQAYTNDRDLLRKAVDRATSGLYTQFAGDSQRIRGQLETLLGSHPGESASERIQSMANETTGGHGAPSGNAINAMQAQMVLNMLQFDENISNLQGGRATIFPLLALVRGQTLLPGRKTIVYFNQGLVVDPSLQSQFESVISTANRANVSIYPVDARGLQSGRNTQSGTDALAGALAASKSQNLSGGRGAVSPDQARAADAAEYSIRANAQNALRDLADSTGGAFIGETNDFRTPLHKLNEDVNSYYELTYDPHIENYDGRLRRISVKMARADL